MLIRERASSSFSRKRIPKHADKTIDANCMVESQLGLRARQSHIHRSLTGLETLDRGSKPWSALNSV